MKSTHLLAALSLAVLLLGTSMSATAGEGHDHGDAAPAAAGTALPRFAAVSETFELVGVLDGKQVTLYLDRFADNAPVRGAKIELEIDRIEKRLSKIAYGGPNPATRSLEDCYGRLEQMARFWFDNHKIKEATP